MKKVASLCAAFAMVLALCAYARGAEPTVKMQTVAVVALSGYDELYRDIDFLGQASGNPDLARGVEGLVAIVTQLQGLAGLDKAQPLGAAVRTDGVQFQMLAFVPVKNVKHLFSALSGVVGVPEKMGDRRWRISTRAGTAFVREQGGWAFVAQLEDNLNDLPADPAALLEDLHKQYDLAVRVHMRAIPDALRDMLLDQFKQKMQAARARASQPQRSMADQLLAGSGDQAVEALNQLDELTLGWSLDAVGRRTFLDVSFTGVAGSKLAALAAPVPLPSKLAGFMLGEAPLSIHVHRQLQAEAVKRDLAVVNSIKQSLAREIEKGDILTNDAEKAKVTAWVEQIAAALSATVRKGLANGGLVAFDSPPRARGADDPFASPAALGPITVAAGFELEQTDTLEQVFRQASKLAEAASPAPQVRLDVEKLGEIRFHRVTMPTDDLIALADVDDDALADIMQGALGDEAQLTLAFGPQRVFLALGPDGLATIKKVVERSSGSTAAADDARVRVRLALGPLVEWWLDEDVNPLWAQVVEEVAKSGKDHVTFTVRPIPGGLRFRLEGEEGIVKALGVGLKFMAVGGGPGGF